MLSTPEECRARALTDCDSRYTKFLLDCAAYSLTGEWQKDSGNNAIVGDPAWPWQLDIWPSNIQIEKSRRLTDSNTMRRSRHMGGSVEPRVIGVDKYTAEGRLSFWRERYRGDGRDSGWEHEAGGMFDDFDLLGVGSAGVGLVNDPVHDKQKVSVRHFKATDVLWERNCRHPARSNRVTRRFFMTLEQALWEFTRPGTLVSREDVYNAATETGDNLDGYPVRIVPVFEYWDNGLPGMSGEGEKARPEMKEPTRCVWIGSLSSGKCAVHQRNPFGCVPHAWMVGKLPPECRYPIGAVVLEMAANEMASQMAAYLIAHLRKSALDIWNKSRFDPRQLANYKKGVGDGNLDLQDDSIQDIATLFHREAGASVTNALPMLAQMVDQRYTEAAGLTESDRGNFIEQDKTLGEYQQTQGEAATNRAFGQTQVNLGLIRLIDRVFMVAERFDRCPVMLDVFGNDFWVNDPTDPRSTCAELFAEPGRNVVDQGALTATDARQEGLRRLNALNQLLPLVEGGQVSKRKFAEETLKAIGESETDEWMPTQQELLQEAAKATLQAPAA